MNRRDGKKLKVDAMHKLQIRFMPKRCDSDVFVNQKIDITNLVSYIEKYNKKNPEDKITYFHAFCTAIAKTVYNRPYLNRFIINKNFYERNNVSVAFAAKISFEDSSREVLSVINVDDKDNILTLRDKIKGRVNDIRKAKDDLGSTDKTMEFLGKLPKHLLSFAAHIIKFLDNHDWLPKSITSDSLYHSTVLLSNVGSIGGDALYHHLTDFGTNSILMTMGRIYKEEVVDENGKKSLRSFCDFGVTLDERIADGFYFIKSLRYFEEILNDPKLMLDPCDKKIVLKDKE